MPHYRIMPEDSVGDSYWVYALSEEEARQLVAAYAEPDAIDEDLYDCELDDTHTPPQGIVYSSSGHSFSKETDEA